MTNNFSQPKLTKSSDGPGLRWTIGPNPAPTGGRYKNTEIPMPASTATVAARIAKTYQAKRLRRTNLIDEILELDDNERNDLVGQLLTMLEDQANGKTSTLRRASNPPPKLDTRPKLVAKPKPKARVIHIRDLDGKPRYTDLVHAAIAAAGRMVNAEEIFEYAKTVRPTVKRSSMDTIVSRLGTNKLLRRKLVKGSWFYGELKKKPDRDTLSGSAPSP